MHKPGGLRDAGRPAPPPPGRAGPAAAARGWRLVPRDGRGWGRGRHGARARQVADGIDFCFITPKMKKMTNLVIALMTKDQGSRIGWPFENPLRPDEKAPLA